MKTKGFIFALLISSLFLTKGHAAVKTTLGLPQTGWPCKAVKIFSLATDGYIVSPGYEVYLNDRLVLSGAMEYKGNYWSLHQYTADISSLTTAGLYRLVIENYTEGTFSISNDVFKRIKNKSGYVTIPDIINSFWRFQRCTPEKCYTPTWNDTRYYKHVNDSCLPLYEVVGNIKTQVAGLSKELYGGWHDAVSVDKQSPNMALSVMNMSHALEKLTDTSSRKALTDEMKWGLAYLLKVQNDDGSFPACIWPYFYWENPSFPRHVEINKATGIVARCAGALAAASVVLKNSDPELSVKSRNAAERAWDWVSLHPDHFEFDNLPSWRTGSSSTVLCAAVELARATDVSKYYSYADSIISLGTFYNKGYWAKDTTMSGPKKFYGQPTNEWIANMDEVSYGQAPVALARYYNITHNAAVKSKIQRLCQSYVSKIKADANNPYGMCESMFSSWWGFLNTSSDLAKCLLQIGIELNDPDAIALALKQYEWIVGFNPMGSSFIIGFGNDPIISLQVCERVPENTIGGILPGMILLNGALSNHYDQYNQWSICEVGESSAVLFDLLAGFNKIFNSKDSVSGLPSVLHTASAQKVTDLTVAPNPAKDKITVFYKTDAGKTIALTLYASDSTKLLTISSRKKEDTVTFDVPGFASGFYFIVLSVDGQVKDRKTCMVVR
jgi:hypothetical protein